MNKRIETFIRLMEQDKNLRRSHKWGLGSSREVYKLGELIIKLPRNYFSDDKDLDCRDENGISIFGVLQSRKEIQVWENSTMLERKMLATMYCHGEINGYPYIVMEEVKVAENMDIYVRESEELPKLAKGKGLRLIPAYQRVIELLCIKYKLKSGDLFENSGNFGITKDKQIVICDYGFCGWDRSEYVTA